MSVGRRILLWIDPFPTPGNEACRTEPVRWFVAAMVLFVCTEAIDSSLVVVQAVLAFGCCIAIAVAMVTAAVYIKLRSP